MKKTDINLIPNVQNPTPDYYCTWQTQLYATSDGKPPMQRQIIEENSLFNREKPFGWAYFYEKIRNDLYLVMDDSWDVPKSGEREYFGSLILSRDKFPKAYENTENPDIALKNLSQRIKALGWKGLGGWVCAEESEIYLGDDSVEQYWEKRILSAKNADISYWKVDWGKKMKDISFRQALTDKAKKIAPNLTIEHSFTKDIIPTSDVYRTYDVPALLSIPLTMKKIVEFSENIIPNENYMGLINCEDEAYIAAAGGFAMGIMRHEYCGEFPNGKKDMSFPEIHRNIKSKAFEIIRAVRWHKIAPAFAADCQSIHVSEDTLHDYWHFESLEDEMEAWWLKMSLVNFDAEKNTISAVAPARISRVCALPEITPDENKSVPFVIASKNPNGIYSIATLGRTVDRSYRIPKCDVRFDIENASIIGVFGDYKNLILKTVKKSISKILLQDLADDKAFDITEKCIISNGEITVSGDIINEISSFIQPANDTSECGVIIKII